MDKSVKMPIYSLVVKKCKSNVGIYKGRNTEQNVMCVNMWFSYL